MLKLNKKQKEATDDADGQEPTAKSPQGITSRGNALHKIGLVALLITLSSVLAGFAFLIFVREPVLQEEKIDQIATFFASQQAASIDRLLSRMEERIQSAAKSPWALSAIASQSAEDVATVEKTMLDYFPEVLSLRIIAVGDLGTADFAGGNRGLRNHIEVDLVRRSSEAEETQPQAYKFEGQWLTSMAARVTHPRISDRQAVIIITLDNKRLAQQLESFDTSAGKFSVEQVYISATGVKRSDVIASSGSANKGPNTRKAKVPGTAWRVAYSPSDSMTRKLEIPLWPLIAVFALISIALFGSVFYLLKLFPRKLESEVNNIISAADRKSPLELQIPELVSIAKQLRRATLRALRQNTAGSTDIPKAEVRTLEARPTDLTNPMFQSKNMLDQDEDLLELDLAATGKSAEAAPSNEGSFPKHIFRAYDIRGNAQSELTDSLVTKIGRAIGSIAGEMGEQALIVGCDGRISSPRIKSALIRALMDTGRDVIDIGLVPTPLLYFATRHLGCRSGVMITGSHNPGDQNGLKIVLDQQTIAAGGIQQVRDRAITGDFATGNGRLTREDVVPAYVEEVLHDIAIAVPLKIVIDAGNGATSEIAPKLFEELGCEVIKLNCVIDGNFPNHPPDTSNEDNLAELAATVIESQADFGVAFDGDGDRLAVVTSSGVIIRSDVLLMLYAQDVVSRNPGADVVFDVKCSRNLTKLITRHGGRPVLWKTGHAFMKEKMRETGALLGGEFSGHMFFGERWYGFDDGMYAAGRLAEILSTHGDSLDDSISQFPVTVNTPEIIIPVPDAYKFKLVKQIIDNADFSSGKVNTMDGIRVDFSNGWGLVRASNTGPALTARFEADTQENLEIIQDEFRAQIALIDPEIKLGF